MVNIGLRLFPRKGCPAREGFSVLPSYLSAPWKAPASCMDCSVLLITAVLSRTGCRFCEAKESVMKPVFEDMKLFLRGHKKSKNRYVVIPDTLRYWLLYRNKKCGNTPVANYNQVYRFIKKTSTPEGAIRNQANYAITHFFRKFLVRDMFYLRREKIDFIVDFFGWESKKSVYYYL
jgi:hypothetical protein